MNFADRLKNKAEKAGYVFSDRQIEQYEMFYHMVVEENKHMNLTSITEEEEFIDRHIMDSLSASRMISFDNISKCVDIGTGAGFPGIPLKIMYPDTEFLLLDSLKKRIEYREQFDLCVSRAVAALPVLMEYCIPFIKKNGYFISYKSKKGMEEIEESAHCLKVLGSEIVKAEDFSISDMAAERLLIMIKKVKNTHHLYPRKSGIPSKKPL